MKEKLLRAISIQPQKISKRESEDAGIKSDSGIIVDEDLRESIRKEGELQRLVLESIRTKKPSLEVRLDYSEITEPGGLEDIFKFNFTKYQNEDWRNLMRKIWKCVQANYEEKDHENIFFNISESNEAKENFLKTELKLTLKDEIDNIKNLNEENPKKLKQFYYILDSIKNSEIKISIGNCDDYEQSAQLRPLWDYISKNEISNKSLIILKYFAENGFLDKNFFKNPGWIFHYADDVDDANGLKKLLDTFAGRRIKTRSCSETLEFYNNYNFLRIFNKNEDDNLEKIVRLKMKKNEVLKWMARTDKSDQLRISEGGFFSYFCEDLNSFDDFLALDVRDLEKAYSFLLGLMEKLKMNCTMLNFDDFFYLSKIINSYQEYDKINELKLSEEILNNDYIRHSTDLKEICLFLKYKKPGDEKLPLSVDLHFKELLEKHKELLRFFNLEYFPNSKYPYESSAISGQGDAKKNYYAISKLDYLEHNENLKKYIKKEFEINNFGDLINITNILIKNGNDNFLDQKLQAIKELAEKDKINFFYLDNFLNDEYSAQYIFWLSKIKRETGFDIVGQIRLHGYANSKLNQLKDWFNDMPTYQKAKNSGYFSPEQDNRSMEYSSYYYKYRQLTEIINDQNLFNFLEQNKDLDLFGFTIDDFNSAYQWFADQDAFYKAKSLGLFSKRMATPPFKNLKKYESISEILRTPYLCKFLTDNSQYGFMQLAIDDYRDPVKKNSINNWIEDEVAFNRAQELGVFLNNPNYLFDYQNVKSVGDIKDEDVEDIRNFFDKNKFPFNFPGKFVKKASRKKEEALGIAKLSRPLFHIKYDEQYDVNDYFTRRLDYIGEMSDEGIEKMYEYLEDAKIIIDLHEHLGNDILNLEWAMKKYNLSEDVKVEAERLFRQLMAPWRERKEVIDFLELSGYRLQDAKQLEALKRLTKGADMKDAANVYTLFNFKIKKEEDFNYEDDIYDFEIFVKNFGLARIPIIYQYVKELLKGSIPAELESAVKNSGERGVKELKEYVNSKIQILVKHEEEIDPAMCGSLELEIYRYLVRFDLSQFKRNKDFKTMLVKLKKTKDNGEIRPLDFNFHTAEIRLESVPKNLDLSKFSESYAACLNVIRRGLAGQLDLSEMKDRIAGNLEKDISEQEKIIVDPKTKESGKEAIRSGIEKTQVLMEKIKQADDKGKILKIIGSVKYNAKWLPELVHQIVISDYIAEKPIWKESLENISRETIVKLENIERIIEFLNIQIKAHAIDDEDNEGLYLDLTNDERKRLKSYFSSKELNKAQEEVRKSKSEELPQRFTIQPSRYIMGEFSGYFGDACWTVRDEILKNNPNMTPLVFVEDAGATLEIVGCTLIFENTINQGLDKVLVLRGVDPQDRLMAKASADSFCRSVISYAKEVAKKKGCKYIMANTGAGTISNRPGITGFFSKFYPKTEKEGGGLGVGNVIKLDEKLAFNGPSHDITESCQIIAIIE